MSELRRKTKKTNRFLRFELLSGKTNWSMAGTKGVKTPLNSTAWVHKYASIHFFIISRQGYVLFFDSGNEFYDIATLSSCFIRLGDCLFEIVMKYLLYRAIRINCDNWVRLIWSFQCNRSPLFEYRAQWEWTSKWVCFCLSLSFYMLLFLLEISGPNAEQILEIRSHWESFASRFPMAAW